MISSIDETKVTVELTPPPYTNKQDYKGGTNDKTRDSLTRETSDSPSDTDSCARNLDEEHNNEEDDDYIDPQSKKEIRLIRNYKKKSGIGYYLKPLLKVIKSVMFDIDNHEKEILAVGYENKIVTEVKWNQLNIIDIQSLLGTNHRLPLSHMAKSFIFLEEKNQRINEFSIRYMMNPNLHKNKAFKDQVRVCFPNIPLLDL